MLARTSGTATLKRPNCIRAGCKRGLGELLPRIETSTMSKFPPPWWASVPTQRPG